METWLPEQQDRESVSSGDTDQYGDATVNAISYRNLGGDPFAITDDQLSS